MSIGLSKINPFVHNAPFLYPLKTSENRYVFWCFQGVEKERIGNKWFKDSIIEALREENSKLHQKTGKLENWISVLKTDLKKQYNRCNNTDIHEWWIRGKDYLEFRSDWCSKLTQMTLRTVIAWVSRIKALLSSLSIEKIARQFG